MVWFKVDDQLHDHRKARKAGKAAMGVWVLAGSWCAERENDGFVPDDVLSRWGSRADAAKLVSVGFWDAGEKDGEPGWWFHDWTVFQPDAATLAAERAAKSTGGALGNHTRWHVSRGVSVPDCEFCCGIAEDSDERSDDRSVIDRSRIADASPVPVPDPNSDSSTKNHVSPGAIELASRPDVEAICDHLADRVEANTGKRPTVTKAWRDAARLMLDRDGRTEQQAHAAIDWATKHEFWRSNILSLPKLREKYDQLRLQAQRTNGPTSTDDLFARAAQRMGVGGIQ